MAVTVKKAVLWRKELANRPGTLSEALKPLADSRVDLTVVMGYAYPGDSSRAALEVYPVSGKRAEEAARSAGLAPTSAVPCLMVEGDNAVGLGHKMASAMSEAGINLGFVVIQVVGGRYLGIFGFDSQSEAERALPLLKAAAKAVTTHRLRPGAAQRKKVTRVAAQKSGMKRA